MMFRDFSIFIQQIVVDSCYPIIFAENVVYGISMRGFNNAYHYIYMVIFMPNKILKGLLCINSLIQLYRMLLS